MNYRKVIYHSIVHALTDRNLIPWGWATPDTSSYQASNLIS